MQRYKLPRIESREGNVFIKAGGKEVLFSYCDRKSFIAFPVSGKNYNIILSICGLCFRIQTASKELKNLRV